MEKQKSFGNHLSLYIPICKSYGNVSKNALEEFNAPRFLVINEIARNQQAL